MKAREYFAYKKALIPDIKRAFRKLEEQADIIVIEGAGSPAEINLKENDIVNMGMAELVDAPVLLVGDIDRGGIFAQLLGTLLLLEPEEKERVKGLIINKFRGDKTILDSGIQQLEHMGGVPVVGTVPYMKLSLEDEDSLTERFDKKEEGLIDLAVICYPRISNFTDFHVFEQMEGVSIRYVTSVEELRRPDMIFLPGSKNTMGDLKWMRQNGLEAAVKKLSQSTMVFGICGGYQMLGAYISDPHHVEEGGSIRGMELLKASTILEKDKVRTQLRGRFGNLSGALQPLSGMSLSGYEIHMGNTVMEPGAECMLEKIKEQAVEPEGMVCQNVYGTYVHGVFDEERIAAVLIEILAEQKGITMDTGSMMDYRAFKETQYDLLAETLREYLDIDGIYQMLRTAKMKE